MSNYLSVGSTNPHWDLSREAEEKKRKEELERHKVEEQSRAADAAKEAVEKVKKENGKRKTEEQSKAAEVAKKAVDETRKKVEMERRMDTVALVRAQIKRREKENLLHSPVSKALTVVVGKNWKRIAMVAVPSRDPKGNDPDPGDDDDYVEPELDDDEDPENPLPHLRNNRGAVNAS
ncbi:hypothetical protein GGU11DRAFT_751974 [Lentinula aff. detonsa]|nr:hypothetical protein GGU11DRAFT_751974 [Lentinula aff. detonsa]